MFKKLPSWVVFLIILIVATAVGVVIKLLSFLFFVYILGVLTGIGIILFLFPSKTSLR